MPWGLEQPDANVGQGNAIVGQRTTERPRCRALAMVGLTALLSACGVGRVEITPQLSATQLEVGETLEVDYRLETNTGKATRIRFDLDHPQELIRPVLPDGELLGDCRLIRDGDGDMVRIERSGDAPLEEGTSLCTVSFEAIGAGKGRLAAVGQGFGPDDKPAGSVGGAGPEHVEFTVAAKAP